MIPELTHEYYLRAKRLLAFKQRVLDHIRSKTNPPVDNTYKYDMSLFALALDNRAVILKIETEIRELEWTLSMLKEYLEI